MHGAAVWMSFVGHFSSSVSRFALTRHIITMGTHTYYNNTLYYIYMGKRACHSASVV